MERIGGKANAYATAANEHTAIGFLVLYGTPHTCSIVMNANSNFAPSLNHLSS